MVTLLKQNIFKYLALTVLILVASFLNAWFEQTWALIPVGLLVVVIFLFIYQKIERGILLIAFFLPFERLGSLEVGVTIRISQLLLLITLVAWLAKSLINKDFKLAKNPLLIFLAGFLVINLISLVNTPNIPRSVTVLAYTFFTAALAFIIPQLVKSKELLKKILVVLIVSATVVCLFGVWQFFGDLVGLPTELTGLRQLYTKDILGFPRIQSTAYEPLYFANYLLLPFALIFILWLTDTKLIKKIYLIPLVLLLGFNLIFTVARGAYLALAVMAVIIFIVYFKKFFQPRKHLILLVIFLTLIIGGLAILQYTGQGINSNLDFFTKHLGNIFQDTSFNERYFTLEQSLVAWAQHPVIGVGIGAFGPWLSPDTFSQPQDGWPIVNNQTLETLAENGALGLLALVLMIGFLLLSQIKAIQRTNDQFTKTILYVVFIALIGLIVQYQTFSTLYIMHVWFIVGVAIAGQNLVLTGADKIT